jgi:signal transduction histidine kinase
MSDSRPVPLLGRPHVADVALALLVAALSVVGAALSRPEDTEDVQTAPWLGGLLLLVGALSLSLRGPAPVAVLAVSAAASVSYQALGHQPLPLPIAVLVALYAVVLSRPLLGAVAAGLYLAAISLASVTSSIPLDDDHLFSYVVAVVATVTVGYGVALGRARATLAEQRATQLAQEQDARTRAAVEQEQSRIAREVHDIVAHDVSVIVAQARAARAVVDHQPQTAARALSSIESVGRDALDGLRRLMGLLRTAPEDDGRSARPRLADLPRLVDQVRRAGLPVDLTVRGHPRPLPATLELNAYRVVQEALTNSLKHAGPTSASVELTYTDDSLLVEVRDGGRGRAVTPDGDGATGGFGLVSMRQRVAMHGGDLDASAQDGAGFHVAATFPMASGVS